MTEFTIKLAGTVIRVKALHESSRDFCSDFLTDEEPDFEVVMNKELIREEQEHGGEDYPVFSDNYLEQLAIFRQIAERMAERGVLLFHSSAISVDGEAYLFTAPSGTGKSTHARLWREVLPKEGHEVFMVNDDKPLIWFREDGVFVCGTPWNGKHQLGTNAIAPVKAICRICRGETNAIRRISAVEELPVLLSQTYRPKDKECVRMMLALLGRIVKEVPMYELHCNMDPGAALVSYRGMQ